MMKCLRQYRLFIALLDYETNTGFLEDPQGKKARGKSADFIKRTTVCSLLYVTVDVKASSCFSSCKPKKEEIREPENKEENVLQT